MNGCVAHRSGFAGTVVDLETGRPIEGAIVVAHWHMRLGMPGKTDGGVLRLMETVTDENGKFGFPSWMSFYLPDRGFADDHRNPELLIFKPSYRFKKALNYGQKSQRLTGQPYRNDETGVEEIRPAEWNGKVFKLRKVALRADRALSAGDLLDHLNSGVFNSRPRSRCLYGEVVRLLSAANQEYLDFKSPGGDVSTLSHYREAIRRCDQKELFSME
jgi:hypothetical protein